MLTYVETFRARRVAYWTLGLVLASFVLSYLIGAEQTHQWWWRVPAQNPDVGQGIPLSGLIGVSGFIVLVVATILGTSLAAQRAGLRMLWTLPVSRERMALGTYATDIAAMAVIWIALLVMLLVPMALLGILPYLRYDGDSWLVAGALGAAALMWYGELQLITAMLPERAGMVAGFSWLFALVDSSLAGNPKLLAAVHDFAVLLRWINPLSYISSVNVHAGRSHIATSMPSVPIAAAIAFTIGIVALIAATVVWRRVEV